MVARDINSNPTQYRTWVVPNTPDFDGYYYTGYKSGRNDFVDVHAYAILDDNAIVDFGLPIPTEWVVIDDRLNVPFPIRKVLPEDLASGQLAVVDGYVYIFGGKTTNKIFRAPLNNPADWVDTGATLPTIVYAASLAIVNNTIYIFGGNNGNESDPMGRGALDNIFSAPVSNPLNWTDHGSLLPRRLQHSSLGMANGFLYLFGGLEINHASDIIFRAPTSDPLDWIDTGDRLPMAIYGSTFAQINNNWMIFGGLVQPDTPVNLIWSAPVSSPGAWYVSGALPYSCAFGQFVSTGNDGYIIGPMVNPTPTTTYTSILKCNFNDPNAWVDTQRRVPGVISESQLAIIYDRIWLFGGNGLSAIFACNQNNKYSLTSPKVQNYGEVTRTVLQATDNLNNPFEALSIPYWLTDYNF